MTRRLTVVDEDAAKDALMAELAHRAYTLKRSGYSLFDIAEELSVTEAVVREGLRLSLATASRLVADGTRQDMLALEVDRLDALQRAVWEQAMMGDVRAVDSALKIIAQRAKLLGLEVTAPENVNQTVVVAGDSRTYIEALRAISAQGEVTDG